MSLEKIKLYKTLSKDDFKKIDVRIKREYYTLGENNKKILLKEAKFENVNETKSFQLIDETETPPKLRNLFLNIDIKIFKPHLLFGKDGIVPEGSEIGIGLTWRCTNSRIKQCKKIGVINKSEEIAHLSLNEIEIDDLSNNIDFNLIFYIYKPSRIEEKFVANKMGMVIYDEHIWSIIITGNGSLFPINLVFEPKSPLWWFECNVDDINEDLFDDEHVCVYLNKSHKLFSMIDKTSNSFDPSFIDEIMSNVITVIIMQIRNKMPNDRFNIDQPFDKGTILQALVYYKTILNWDINGSYDKLLKSIKNWFSSNPTKDKKNKNTNKFDENHYGFKTKQFQKYLNENITHDLTITKQEMIDKNIQIITLLNDIVIKERILQKNLDKLTSDELVKLWNELLPIRANDIYKNYNFDLNSKEISDCVTKYLEFIWSNSNEN